MASKTLLGYEEAFWRKKIRDKWCQFWYTSLRFCFFLSYLVTTVKVSIYGFVLNPCIYISLLFLIPIALLLSIVEETPSWHGNTTLGSSRAWMYSDFGLSSFQPCPKVIRIMTLVLHRYISSMYASFWHTFHRWDVVWFSNLGGLIVIDCLFLILSSFLKPLIPGGLKSTPSPLSNDISVFTKRWIKLALTQVFLTRCV